MHHSLDSLLLSDHRTLFPSMGFPKRFMLMEGAAPLQLLAAKGGVRSSTGCTIQRTTLLHPPGLIAGCPATICSL